MLKQKVFIQKWALMLTKNQFSWPTARIIVTLTDVLRQRLETFEGHCRGCYCCFVPEWSSIKGRKALKRSTVGRGGGGIRRIGGWRSERELRSHGSRLRNPLVWISFHALSRNCTRQFLMGYWLSLFYTRLVQQLFCLATLLSLSVLFGRILLK